MDPKHIGFEASLSLARLLGQTLGDMELEISLLVALGDLEASAALVLRARLRLELPEIIEALQPYGPLVLA
jgi:hypothetical protein